jgi:hypothetical protein
MRVYYKLKLDRNLYKVGTIDKIVVIKDMDTKSTHYINIDDFNKNFYTKKQHRENIINSI